MKKLHLLINPIAGHGLAPKIEGMIASSFALGANTAYIYIRGEYFYVHRILENAIKEAYANGWLGKNILGTGYDLDLYMQIGAGAYICGEETGLLESIEGKSGKPRLFKL